MGEPDLFITPVSVVSVSEFFLTSAKTCIYCTFEYFIYVWCLDVWVVLPVIASGRGCNETWQCCKWSTPQWQHRAHLLPPLFFAISLLPFTFPLIPVVLYYIYIFLTFFPLRSINHILFFLPLLLPTPLLPISNHPAHFISCQHPFHPLLTSAYVKGVAVGIVRCLDRPHAKVAVTERK